MKTSIADIRKDYIKEKIDPSSLSSNPIIQFKIWLHNAIDSNVNEPTAMNLCTVSNNKPSSRIVLLKEVNDNGFVFFTNYESEKGKQIANNPFVSLTFFWPELERQVRIEGEANKVSDEESDNYFRTRPRGSKIGAWASPQSQVIESREVIEKKVKILDEEFQNEILRPSNWGGFCVKPVKVEFWQGGANRLHDRILYQEINGVWTKVRLAP
jgi:pyridoxamine 5'-phosphate oxidase